MKRQFLKCLDQDQLMADEQSRMRRPPEVAPVAGKLSRDLVVWVNEVVALLARLDAARARCGRRTS